MNLPNILPHHRILVVDDNPAIHLDFRKILGKPMDDTQAALMRAKVQLFGEKRTGPDRDAFEIDSAHQGEEALYLLKKSIQERRPYALAFVDVRMPPGWDGIETITHLWQASADLQVVICTAYSDYSWDEIAERLGKSDKLVILKKPFDNIEVLQLAHTLTEKWALAAKIKVQFTDLDRLVGERTVELQAANEQLRRQIAEQARLQAELRHAVKMEAVGQLSAGVAHEFNNILTIIQGYAEIMMGDAGTGARSRSMAEKIRDSVERAAGLVKQLLTYSCKQPLRPQQLSFEQVLRPLQEVLKRILGERVVLDLAVPDDLPGIWADLGMMTQMLMDLVLNARDAMPKGGRLTIQAESATLTQAMESNHPDARPGKYLRITVRDTGTGIAPDVLLRIFEPFFTTKEVGKGTGLGLSVVYGIVKQHAGWIEVKTTSGKGASFIIYLPVYEGRPIPTAKRAEPVYIKGGGEVILLAEDEEMLREITQLILEHHGYSVIPAPSGDEALNLWAEHRNSIHLLLTDLVMPGKVQGEDLARRVLTDNPGIKVLYFSGYSPTIAGKDLALIEGFNFLPKPFQAEDLLRMVRQSLDKKSAPVSAPPPVT